MLKRFFSARVDADPVASLPAGRRVYAIGDIHGRLDLLDDAIARIDADEQTRPEAQTTLVFLGDLIDRGDDSAGVIERLCTLAGVCDARFLLGNHEEAFLLTLDGDLTAARMFCRIGGRETAISYGIAPDEYESLGYEELVVRLQEVVPAAHRRFLLAFEDLVTIGDYAFVHAGIRPEVPLAEQKPEDLRWIRAPFLDHRGVLEKVVVHGHTISDEVEFRRHRIGIDTGGYATNRLSVLALEGDGRRLLPMSASSPGSARSVASP